MAKDDGTIHTHFAYEWEGINHPKVQHRLQQGLMPEMHVWAADPVAMELVDTSTIHLAEQCRKQGGMEWTAPPPPSHLWAGREQMPPGWHYMAAADAIQLIMPDAVESVHACGRIMRGQP